MEKKKNKKRDKIKPKPRVHKDLSGLEVSIDSFGEIRSSMNIEEINAFLDKNVDDKKLSDREEPDDTNTVKMKAKRKTKK